MPDLELRGREVRIRASEGMEIECGRTALRMDPRGNLRLRGQHVVCEDERITSPARPESKKPFPN
jgi:hypothetical protein